MALRSLNSKVLTLKTDAVSNELLTLFKRGVLTCHISWVKLQLASAVGKQFVRLSHLTQIASAYPSSEIEYSK